MWRKQLKAFGKGLVRYFVAYGGWKAVFGSPYFLVAILITGLSYSRWITPQWVDLSIAQIPTLLGFSLGTYAILFSLVTNRLKTAMKVVTNDEGVPFLDEINATFFHFILVQVIAWVWALLFDGTGLVDVAKAAQAIAPWSMTALAVATYVGSFVGMLLLVYSFLLVLGAAFAVYRIASITDRSAE